VIVDCWKHMGYTACSVDIPW